MKFRIILYVAVFAFISACGHKQDEHKYSGEAVMEEDHHDAESQILELDSGKKWIVNPEMMVHIRNIKNDVNQFNGSTLPEYKNLAEKLKQYNTLVISSCTMTGKAHEQLHVWLLPFIDLTKKFADSGSESEASEYFREVRNSIDKFNRYFE